jgi:hypothetical protein
MKNVLLVEIANVCPLQLNSLSNMPTLYLHLVSPLSSSDKRNKVERMQMYILKLSQPDRMASVS